MNAGYNFFRRGNDFEFFTAFGTSYVVSFIPVISYFENQPIKDFIYSVDIIRTDIGPYNCFDSAISITIAEILFYFFELDNRNVVFYICETKDGKFKSRMRKFDYLYKFFNTGDYNKISTQIDINKINVEANFIFKKNNVFAYDLPVIIDEAKDNLSK